MNEEDFRREYLNPVEQCTIDVLFWKIVDFNWPDTIEPGMMNSEYNRVIRWSKAMCAYYER